MVAAVIVTHNRKELLGENIRMLLQQTKPFDRIFIVDNCSTDGTAEYLEENGWKNRTQFIYLKTESNIGGAGGFYIGTKAAFESGADWIVLLNNDVVIEQHNFQQILMQEYEREKFYVAGPDIVTPEGNSQNPYLSECPQKKDILKKLLHDYLVLFLMKMHVQQKIKKIS